MHMLNTTCNLIFKPKLLLEEYNLSYAKGSNHLPVKKAFEKLINKMGGSAKPHIVMFYW